MTLAPFFKCAASYGGWLAGLPDAAGEGICCLFKAKLQGCSRDSSISRDPFTRHPTLPPSFPLPSFQFSPFFNSATFGFSRKRLSASAKNPMHRNARGQRRNSSQFKGQKCARPADKLTAVKWEKRQHYFSLNMTWAWLSSATETRSFSKRRGHILIAHTRCSILFLILRRHVKVRASLSSIWSLLSLAWCCEILMHFLLTTSFITCTHDTLGKSRNENSGGPLKLAQNVNSQLCKSQGKRGR